MGNITVSEFKDITSRTVKHTPVTENYVAIQVETVRTSVEGNKPGEILSKNVYETICHRDTVILFEQGATGSQVPRCDVHFLTDAVLKCYREYGFHGADDEAAQAWCGVSKEDLEAIDKPFSAITSGLKGTPVRMDFSSHMLFNPEKDEIYPVAIELDYIGFNLSNDRYDLEIASKLLDKNPNVRLYKRNDEAIHEIDYFNASTKKSRCLRATFMPTTEMANRLWEVCKKLDTRFASCRFEEAIDVIDALGLIEGGAMREKHIKEAKSMLED